MKRAIILVIAIASILTIASAVPAQQFDCTDEAINEVLVDVNTLLVQIVDGDEVDTEDIEAVREQLQLMGTECFDLELTPSPTPRPVTYYITARVANARSCERTNCGVVTTFSIGEQVQVLRTVPGENTLGSADWYEVQHGDDLVYIHSSLASRNRPAPTFTPRPSSNTGSSGNTGAGSTGGSTSGGNSGGQPVSTPAPPPVSTAPPYTCNCSRTCGQMTCEEAYYQLNVCGCSQRDGDGDGVPCESICPGG